VLGTADYVAPEQALNSHDVDTRADVYGLGATFHFLLTGQPPFPGGKVAQKLIWHQVKRPTSVREIRPEVPEAMAVVVARMMAKSPTDRVQSAADVVEALPPWLYPPVPSPTESEIPQLSLAARSPGSGSFDPSSTVHRAGATRTTASRTLVPGEETRTSRGALPSTSAPTPPPLTHAKPALPEDQETPAAGAAEVAVQKDGDPPEPAAAAPAPAAGRKPPDRRSQALRLALILMVGLACGSTARRIVGRPAAAQPPSVSGFVVDHSGQPGTYPTIAAALQQAPPGARIVVRAEAWEEALHVPADGTSAVRIEGQAPGGDPSAGGRRRTTPPASPCCASPAGPACTCAGWSLTARSVSRASCSSPGPARG
jgi:hypothetical protein